MSVIRQASHVAGRSALSDASGLHMCFILSLFNASSYSFFYIIYILQALHFFVKALKQLQIPNAIPWIVNVPRCVIACHYEGYSNANNLNARNAAKDVIDEKTPSRLCTVFTSGYRGSLAGESRAGHGTQW